MVDGVLLAPCGELNRGGVLGKLPGLEICPDLDLASLVLPASSEGLAEWRGCLCNNGELFVFHLFSEIVNLVHFSLPSLRVFRVHDQEVFICQLHCVCLCVVGLEANFHVFDCC